MALTRYQVMIVDDQALFRGGLSQLLGRDPRITLVAEPTTGHDALALAAAHRPDLVLLNVELPGLTGLHIAAGLRRHVPSVPVVFLARSPADTRVFDAIYLEASAYLTQATSLREVVQAVEAVLEGENLMEAALATFRQSRRELDGPLTWPQSGRSLAEPAMLFTLRELQVLDCVVMGYTNPEVATEQGIAEQSVKNYVSTILRKLDVPDRKAVLRHAATQGWINVGPRPTTRGSQPLRRPRAHVIAHVDTVARAQAARAHAACAQATGLDTPKSSNDQHETEARS